MKRSMTANLVAALIFVSVLVGVTVAQEKSWATLTLKNNSQFEVELYVTTATSARPRPENPVQLKCQLG